jgi:hypothetical protein
MVFPFKVPAAQATILLLFLELASPIAFAAEVLATQLPLGAELLSNSNFALASQDPTWPADWRKKPGISWVNEKDARYLRFVVNEPGATVETWRDISFPIAQGVKALQATIRYRTSRLKIGAGKEAGAKISFCFFDAVRIAYSPAPEPIIFSEHASDWTVATANFKVPENAVSLIITFGLVQVDSGTLDISELSLKNPAEADVTTPVAVNAGTEPAVSPQATTNAPVPIRREGDRTIIGYGKPSVWFIHPYVDVLGHDFDMGISHLVSEARDQGDSIAVGVANSLDEVNQQDEANTIYVFSYKNINYPLPANARRMVFLNTWLTPSVKWPASRSGKKDMVLLGSRTLHNNGDGLATDKDRWTQIQKDDPSLDLTVLDSAGYYLSISQWRAPLLKVILEEQPNRK